MQHALMQWQHPAAPLSPALLAALSSSAHGSSNTAAALPSSSVGTAGAAAAGERGGLRSDPVSLLLRERVQRWREALRAGYIALRHGHCPILYIGGQVRS